MAKRAIKLAAGLVLTVLFLLAPPAGQTDAQWPPFTFSLSPRYADGIITYSVELINTTNADLADLTIKVPLPAGTQYLDAKVLYPGTQVTFDGAEVSIFTPTLHGSLRGITFRVKVIDTENQLFTTQPWLKWSGNPAGDYLANEVTIDVTKIPLDWTSSFSFLRLDASARVSGDQITYSFYPTNQGWLRMWDLMISVPLPPGTTFVSADAPGIFSTAFDGQQVNFFTIELPEATPLEPLRVTVSTAGVTDDVVVTRAWATWKNEGWGVGTDYPPTDQLETGYIVVQPHLYQVVVTDMTGDVPFSYYDLTSVSFQPDQDALKFTFFTVGDFIGQPDTVAFEVYLDTDCRTDTGDPVADGIGAEYLVGFEDSYGESYFETWDPETSAWVRQDGVYIPAASSSTGNTVSIWLPYDLIPQDVPMCWLARTTIWNESGYTPYPPVDDVLYLQDAKILPRELQARFTEETGTAVASAVDDVTDEAAGEQQTASKPGLLLPITGAEAAAVPSTTTSHDLTLGLVTALILVGFASTFGHWVIRF